MGENARKAQGPGARQDAQHTPTRRWRANYLPGYRQVPKRNENTRPPQDPGTHVHGGMIHDSENAGASRINGTQCGHRVEYYPATKRDETLAPATARNLKTSHRVSQMHGTPLKENIQNR